MPEITGTMDIEVECGTCKQDLKNNVTTREGRLGEILVVEPCATCIDQAIAEAQKEAP